MTHDGKMIVIYFFIIFVLVPILSSYGNRK